MSNNPTNPTNTNMPKPDQKRDDAHKSDDKHGQQQQGQTRPAQQQGSPADTRQPGGDTSEKK